MLEMNRTVVKGTSPYQAKMIAVFEVIKKITINVYTENCHATITQSEFKELRAKPRTGAHIMIKRNIKDPDWKLKTMEEQYKMISIEQKELY
jgi:hypothetical protein